MLKGSILEQLDSAHKSSKRPLNLGVYYKNTLVALCHALEDFILESDSPPIVVTAFQRGKWYLQEAERYGDLADKAAEIAIMSAPDSGFDSHPTSQRDNVTIVSLDPKDPVAQEWHLIILSSSYTAMVLCQELSEADYEAVGKPQEDLERKFYGFWTFEPKLVQETVELAIAHIEKYNQPLSEQLRELMAKMMDEYAEQNRDDLSAVVARVVNYLQQSQKDLHHAERADIFALPQQLDQNIVSNEMQAFLRMAQLIDQTDVSNPMAGAEVAAIAEAMGHLIDLPAWQIKRLRLAGLLHRIGSLSQSSSHVRQSPVQQEILQQSESLPPASVLRIMPQLQALAEILTHQTEAWDGSGSPEGLAYDQIPLESRIIRLVADFQRQLTAKASSAEGGELMDAFNNCQEQAGTIYDPKLIEALQLLVMGMQQGMNIAVNQPKIAAGMWLMDPEAASSS